MMIILGNIILKTILLHLSNNKYNRARAVLGKMKQLYYDTYFSKTVIEDNIIDNDSNNNNNDSNNNNDDNNDNDNNDIESDDFNQYATCMVCRCHIFDMIDIEMHEPRFYIIKSTLFIIKFLIFINLLVIKDLSVVLVLLHLVLVIS